MRHILFYSDKLGDWFEQNIFFSKGELAENFNDDLDQRIHTYLIGERWPETKSFTLPISITGNFYDFSGLTFAHHLRLTRKINCCDATIVCYGILELEQLLRLTPLARILLTENVLYLNIAKFSFDDIKKYLENYLPKQFSIKRFLDQIQVNHPSNYDYHHSIDNEFALMQWSKYIGCYDSIPPQCKKEFECNLYFKYLRVKSPLSSFDSTQLLIQTTAKTRVLLVDDEARKGWEIFYKSFFKDSKIEFVDSGIEFKNIDKNDIISKVRNNVKEFKPDIVLLDLRLHDSDFGEDVVPENLTGLEILENIKKINKGIQVIITTASNKAWNFNLAKQKGAYDFIIKDGFEDPEKTISKFKTALEISSKRAGFLKNIDQKLSDIKALIISNDHFKDKDDFEKKPQEIKEEKIRKRMFSNLELAFELLDLSYKIPEKHKYLSYSYLQLFLLIEDFANPDSIEKLAPILYKESDQVFISHSLKQICILQIKEGNKFTRLVFDSKYKLVNNAIILQRKMDTNFFVSSILIYKYGNENSSKKDWTSVYTVRNNVAHEGYTPNEFEINRLLDFMHYFFDKSSECDTNLDKGLVPITYEESLQALRTKYNHR